MENTRLLLFVALSVTVLLIWQYWQDDYGPKPVIPITTQSTAPKDVPASGVAPAATPTGPASVASEAALVSAEPIKVRTDVLEVEIDTVGGDIRKADLLRYPVKPDQPNEPFRLFSDTAPNVFIAQTGLLSARPAPDHHARFQAEQPGYQLQAGQDTVAVRLHWTGSDGVTVTKVYTFHRGSYVVDVAQEVNNASGAEWRGRQYRQFQRSRVERESRFVYTYTGGVIYSPGTKYQKVDFDKMDKENLSTDLKQGWAAMIQHYFVGAWIPPQAEQGHYYTKALGEGRYALGVISPEVAVAPGASTRFDSRLYVGPKAQDQLGAVAPGLELSVDYGMLTVIAKPLFWGLEWIHKGVQNWGWSILILTLFIKLAFYKLSEKSYRSMANMRRLAPKLQQLKERYGDDRQRMSQGMMELYKKEKINPLGGCLPMIVQIPVFLSLYWVLVESVELRQAPWALWLTDLSSKDPYYILPLIMGVTMFIQQKLNPPPPDPVQAKVFMALPFIFTAFFAFFPAGLVLYWVANNVLSIAQQWHITRRIEQAAAAHHKK